MYSPKHPIEILFRFPENDIDNRGHCYTSWDVIIFHAGQVAHVKSAIIESTDTLHIVEDGVEANTTIFCDAIGDDDQNGLEAIERVLKFEAKTHWPHSEFDQLFNFEISSTKLDKPIDV